MSKRVLIIYRVDEADVSNQGVIKKLNGQAKGFIANGWEADTIRISGREILLNKEPIKKISKSKFGSVLFEFFQSIAKAVDLASYDMLYIRYGLSFAGFTSFLRKAKENSSKLKIILEFATFPYTEEWTGTKGLVVKKVDGHYRKKLRKYVDHVVHLGDEKYILGMPCINSENGIDLTDIRARKKHSETSAINLIAVGKWQFWHGLDRLVKGISESERREEIKLVIVGEGPENEFLQKLVDQNSLEDQIKFVGSKEGKELDDLFDHADVGIGTLGMHRKNITIDSSLKHREYASRGLPFILCAKDKDFSEQDEFIKYYEETDRAIDIQSLVEFAKNTKKIDPEEIRTFAGTRLSWEAKISKILDGIY